MSALTLLAAFFLGLVVMHSFQCTYFWCIGIKNKASVILELYNVCGATALLWVCFFMFGCTPDAPPTGADSPASIRFDQNHQDAGLGNWTVHGFPATQQYHDNYLSWLPKYGTEARAPQDPFAANPTGTHYPWYVTAGGAQAYEEMSRDSK